MPRLSEFYRQLKQRRVIRTGIVYAALVWGALQVADLLAEAGFIQERLVQWLIFTALVGFPLALILSWFYETPWRERKGLSVLGDIAIILAIAVGVFLLAWQQFFTSFTRPTLAILALEATDTRADTPALGNHISEILRTALASRPEIRVTELASSQHAALADRPVMERASILNADYLLSGTVNQGDDQVRLNLQLYQANGELIWSQRHENRIEDLTSLLARQFNELWPQLPLPPEALESARQLISECAYPKDAAAIRVMVNGELPPELTIQHLNEQLEKYPGNGLLHRARAQARFALMDTAPPQRHPVISRLAAQDLQSLADHCPGRPEPGLVQLHTTRVLEDPQTDLDAALATHPNDARIHETAAKILARQGALTSATTAAGAAWHLNPLSETIACTYAKILDAVGDTEKASSIRMYRVAAGLAAPACEATPDTR